MITRPLEPSSWAVAKIFTSPGGGLPYAELPTTLGPRNSGAELLNISRVAFPEADTAVFRFRYGSFVNAADIVTQPLQLPARSYVKIFLDDVCCFIGWIVATRDLVPPGASSPIGEQEYHCRGAADFLRIWRLDRHLSYELAAICRENPGYNTAGMKNRSDATGLISPQDYSAHAYPGSVNATDFWLDYEVVQHALSANDRDEHAPPISFGGYFGQLDKWQEWETSEGDTVSALLERILSRARGVGVSFFDYSGESIVLNTYPAVADAITSPAISGAVSWQDEAETGPFNTTVTVDLQGDHFLGQDATSRFDISEIDDQYFDAVEVLGERIQVLVALETGDKLQAKWGATQETAYAALASPADAPPSLDAVYQTYGLDINNTPASDDGGDGSRTRRADYRTDDNGDLVDPIDIGAVSDTPAATVNILPDLPLLAGYDYSGASPALVAADTQQRLKIQLFYRESDTSEVWIPLAAESGNRPNVTLDGPDLRIELPGATRFGELYPEGTVLALLALEMPHRLRIKRVGRSPARNVKRIFVPGAHMHIAAPGSFYSVVNGALQRFFTATPTTPYKIRDDFFTLEYAAAIASRWYLQRRRTASWSLYCCGLNSGAYLADENGEASTTLTPWPKLGYVVLNILAGGITHAIDTPITRIDYDHIAGRTTWQTGWADRDWSR
jgi:hypothetical protein